MNENINACVYIRVSTTEQADEGYSIEIQERMCKAAIESKGWTYTKTYADPGISGRTMNREGLQAMLAAIERGEVGAVVISPAFHVWASGLIATGSVFVCPGSFLQV